MKELENVIEQLKRIGSYEAINKIATVSANHLVKKYLEDNFSFPIVSQYETFDDVLSDAEMDPTGLREYLDGALEQSESIALGLNGWLPDAKDDAKIALFLVMAENMSHSMSEDTQQFVRLLDRFIRDEYAGQNEWADLYVKYQQDDFREEDFISDSEEDSEEDPLIQRIFDLNDKQATHLQSILFDGILSRWKSSVTGPMSARELGEFVEEAIDAQAFIEKESRYDEQKLSSDRGLLDKAITSVEQQEPTAFEDASTEDIESQLLSFRNPAPDASNRE